jgi:transposase InsO family protein
MPWKESSKMSSRLEFVTLASVQGANIRALCRAFGISPQTGYTLLARYKQHGVEGLKEHSRKPHSSPRRSSEKLEACVLELHDKYPYWGSRKLAALLPEDSAKPHPNTIAAILRRHGRQIVSQGKVSKAFTRFEHEAPNLLWQMDFKGHFALTDPNAGRCHPLTVLDDHSRFAVCLAACAGQTRETVQSALTATFRRYGLPQRITCDNGSPWRVPQTQNLSKLEVWLIRLGIRVGHSTPYHPQTQGKDERFHRTLKRELIERKGFNSLEACQSAFNNWRDQYNLIRPHEALGQKPPSTRYRQSARTFPEQLVPVEYEQGYIVRKVRKSGQIQLNKQDIFIGEGLAGELVALAPTDEDGVLKVLFCHRELGQIDLRSVI